MPHCRYFQLRAAAAPAATLEHKLDGPFKGPQREMDGPSGVLGVRVERKSRRRRRGIALTLRTPLAPSILSNISRL